MANRHLDVIIFGATGFTGKYTVYEAVKVLSTLKWGIAGRNKVTNFSLKQKRTKIKK